MEHHSSQIPSEFWGTQCSPKDPPAAAHKAVTFSHRKPSAETWEGSLETLQSLLRILFFTWESRAGVHKGQICHPLTKRLRESQGSEPQQCRKPQLQSSARPLPALPQPQHTYKQRDTANSASYHTNKELSPHQHNFSKIAPLFFHWDTTDHISNMF